jgi:hypothetical protein
VLPFLKAWTAAGPRRLAKGRSIVVRAQRGKGIRGRLEVAVVAWKEARTPEAVVVLRPPTASGSGKRQGLRSSAEYDRSGVFQYNTYIAFEFLVFLLTYYS